MQDKSTILAPAKVNLFLRVLNKRQDGLHNIKSGITFINLFDEVQIKKSNFTSIKYHGSFSPPKGLYKDCIIKRTLKYLNLENKINLEINIKKNIPVKAGLGSASTNAAAFIKGLQKLNIIQHSHPSYFLNLGSDIPVCLYGKNALVKGIGEKISFKEYPKYFFLLVKPKANFSTKYMYNKLSLNHNKNNVKNLGNDFEKIAIRESKELKKLLSHLSKSKNSILAQMTGSGSCCFSVYNNKDQANRAKKIFQQDFPDLWYFVGENNTVNS